ncbi:hypothetical protein K402DRAFT_235334 [Aulographum hederae CBS 113979]|uniref:Heterokaryon incompatibility domain-containing protein n=1 Tax=Aulographum hederae CBS 113979 TaxID=1176131 RepID=A0A6G1GKY2_9PEZI|nr:hypothetical protein K402DRAFT_235334 [Aulographum hederae CBS 113979]
MPRSQQSQFAADLPSWVPDWSTNELAVPFLPAGLANPTDERRLFTHQSNYQPWIAVSHGSWNAARDFPYDLDTALDHDCRKLPVSGYILDEIRTATHPNKIFRREGSGTDLQVNYREFCDFDRVFFEPSCKRYVNGESLMHVYWDVYTLGKRHRFYDIPIFKWWNRAQDLYRLLRAAGVPRSIPFWRYVFKAVGVLCWLGLSYWMKDLLLFPETCTYLHGRRIMRTHKGYLGLAPEGSQTGDKVALVKGSRIPLILRPKGEYWELVGAAYVHGVMHGEAFDEANCEVLWIV